MNSALDVIGELQAASIPLGTIAAQAISVDQRDGQVTFILDDAHGFHVWVADESPDKPTNIRFITETEWDRDERVEHLRRLTYAEYLKTDHWQHMRAVAREYYGDSCRLCPSNDHLEVHHRTYDRLGCELLADLIVLCHNCHSIFHGKSA